jgi:hypothetical protein
MLMGQIVTQNTFDVLGGVLYILCVVLEGGIFASHLIWLFRTRMIRKEAKEQGRTFDDIAEESKLRGVQFKFGERDLKFWAPRDEEAELSAAETGESK